MRVASFLIAAVLGSLFADSGQAGTVAYYRFENSGNLGLDETGNHNGTPTNGPTQSLSVGQNPVMRTGAANGGSLNLDFTAPADYVNVPDDNALDFGNNPWTIEAYMSLDSQPTTSTPGMYFAQKKDLAADGFADYSFLLAGNRGTLSSGVTYFDNGGYVGSGRNLQVEFGTGTSTVVAFRSVLEAPTTGWAFVSAAYDGVNTVRFTLDTNLSDNLPGSIETIVGSGVAPTINSGSLFIGAKKNATGAPVQGFDGLLDEVRISNMVLPTYELLSVPEPSSFVLAGFGALASLIVAARRRRS